ncbi:MULTISPECIES: hypothetical protein [Rummeliibacillus]|uniref:hypothetical protein n=1 Tax=Rummeliibacillus TaxID=648802 RepID=UPI00289936B0|nr:hypothetical protein [Rummeliibacillus suwonensis]
MIGLAKKMRTADDFLHHLYVHMNELNQFVIFSGLTFREFVSSVGPLQNILLLKNEYEDGSFNMHTQLEFVEAKGIPKFVKRVMDSKGDLCWIDFSDERKLNLLTPQEQAELLYIGHKKEPIRSPFYHQLQNKYVYLSSEEGRFSKIYFRDLEDVAKLVAQLFNNIIQEKERATTFWRRKASSFTPMFTKEMMRNFREDAKDGVLFSMYKIEKPKIAYVMELRSISDDDFPDEIWDDLNSILKKKPDKILETHK